MKITRIERAKYKHDTNKPAGWLIGITDLTTLLLAFFILLFATSTPREKPWVEASESMRTQFGGEANITQVSGEAGQKEAEETWVSQDKDPGLNLQYLFSLVKKQMTQEGLMQSATMRKDKDAVVISFPTELVFKPGGDDVSAKGEGVIISMAAILMKLPNAIEIVGHADPTMVNSDGRFGSNWHLSLARAYAVADTLKQAGYSPSINILGRGGANDDLLPKNLPEAVRNEQLRRVDLRLTLQEN